MARKTKNPTAETLRELEASGDRVAEWASENAAVILGIITGVLVIAGAVGLYVQHGADTRDEAADALAVTTTQYRLAMGAEAVGGPIPEPANPELAESTRSQYAARFAEVAEAHPDTTAGAVAWLEAGKLQAELGRLEEAAQSFSRARDEAAGTAIGALGAIRLAGLAEDRGDPETAARAYETAAAIEAYPLRGSALADAARCWLSAGENDRAIAAFQRLESEFPDEAPPPPLAARIAELRLVAE